MKYVSTLFALVLGLYVGTARAETSQSTLSFTYSGSTGVLRLLHEYESLPSTSCVQRFRGNIYFEGSSTASAVEPLFIRLRQRSRSQRIVLKNLPGVAQRSGKDPVLTLQAKTYCPDGTTFVSNAVARFVSCGSGVRKVSPSSFLRTLGTRMRRAI